MQRYMESGVDCPNKSLMSVFTVGLPTRLVLLGLLLFHVDATFNSNSSQEIQRVTWATLHA